MSTTVPVSFRKPDRKKVDSYFAGIVRDIRRLLPFGERVETWFVPATPEPPAPRPGEVQRLSSKRLILTHPQSGYSRAEDRHGRPYTAETIRREASALIETIKHQARHP